MLVRVRLGGRGRAVSPNSGVAALGTPYGFGSGCCGGAVSPNRGVAAVGDPLTASARLQRWMVGRGAC